MASDKIGYNYHENFEITKEIKDDYEKKGYLVIRNLFSDKEIATLEKFLADQNFFKKRYEIEGPNENVGIIVWNHPGDDLTGWMARCHRVVNAVEKLLEGEVYHYHSKIIMKDPREGGRFQWHQDYGYWYNNGLMFPNLITVSIAMDAANRKNGCIQVLEGSHRMGRVHHTLVLSQAAVEEERLEWAKKLFPHVYLETQPGDAIFLHCNVLHSSSPNTSDEKRHCFVCCYNRMDNDPMVKHHHPNATKLHKVPDDIILNKESPDVSWETKDFLFQGFKHLAMDKLTESEQKAKD